MCHILGSAGLVEVASLSLDAKVFAQLIEPAKDGRITGEGTESDLLIGLLEA